MPRVAPHTKAGAQVQAPKRLGPPPLQFFSHLKWLDGRPLLSTIEPYRRTLLHNALYIFDGSGAPQHNLVVAGKAKKNYKTTDLVLAALYRFLAWESAAGNDAFILANDEGQAADDLALAKKLLLANSMLAREVTIGAKAIIRNDGKGAMQILPARDISGAHGKTYLFVGFDEIHGYRNYDLFEALAPDPTRADVLTWITSYAGIRHAPGIPLYDLMHAGIRGDDPRMLFSWYSADLCTDPAFANLPPEQRANPSMANWTDPGYLDQQRKRLPAHKFRRLHLNLPGAPEGAAFSGGHVVAAIVEGRRVLSPDPARQYIGFVDMSGGSNDDAVLAIAHYDEGRAVLDVVVSQSETPPFNPRHAVKKFASILAEYRIAHVIGDRYAGETFRRDFEDENGIQYQPSELTKHELYEAFEPLLTASEIELLDAPKLQEQLLTLVWRGTKIDHQSGDHDDWANAAVGAIVHLNSELRGVATWAALGGADDGPVIGQHRPGSAILYAANRGRGFA